MAGRAHHAEPHMAGALIWQVGRITQSHSGIQAELTRFGAVGVYAELLFAQAIVSSAIVCSAVYSQLSFAQAEITLCSMYFLNFLHLLHLLYSHYLQFLPCTD
jgi:hypothetical protein